MIYRNLIYITAYHRLPTVFTGYISKSNDLFIGKYFWVVPPVPKRDGLLACTAHPHLYWWCVWFILHILACTEDVPCSYCTYTSSLVLMCLIRTAHLCLYWRRAWFVLHILSCTAHPLLYCTSSPVLHIVFYKVWTYPDQSLMQKFGCKSLSEGTKFLWKFPGVVTVETDSCIIGKWKIVGYSWTISSNPFWPLDPH